MTHQMALNDTQYNDTQHNIKIAKLTTTALNPQCHFLNVNQHIIMLIVVLLWVTYQSLMHQQYHHNRTRGNQLPVSGSTDPRNVLQLLFCVKSENC